MNNIGKDYIKKPEDIEKRSFEIITEELSLIHI